VASETDLPAPTIRADIYVAGDLGDARRICRQFCAKGLCVTVEPVEFIYTGGAEVGVRVGLINYPRFPSKRADIAKTAYGLARLLIAGLFQWSALVEMAHETKWITVRPVKGRLAAGSGRRGSQGKGA
jgi:hypothetical protein